VSIPSGWGYELISCLKLPFDDPVSDLGTSHRQPDGGVGLYVNVAVGDASELPVTGDDVI